MESVRSATKWRWAAPLSAAATCTILLYDTRGALEGLNDSENGVPERSGPGPLGALCEHTEPERSAQLLLVACPAHRVPSPDRNYRYYRVLSGKIGTIVYLVAVRVRPLLLLFARSLFCHDLRGFDQCLWLLPRKQIGASLYTPH